jgi:nicotinamide mononucleotide transporter
MPDLLHILEIIATITGILCVYLQTRENILAWPFGLISVSILVYVFGQQLLYSDMILHIIYIGLNIYGWWFWAHFSDQNQITPTREISNHKFLLWGIGILCGAALWGWIMNSWTNADLAYLDAFTTVGSLCAQFLLARKILQNWIIWIIVDVVAINMYLYKGLYFIALMFLVFLVLCIKGYRDWKKSI